MIEADFMEAIELYGIEWQLGEDKQGNRCIWLANYDRTIFDFVPDGEQLNIIENLRLWFDTGESEIRINETNYMEYDNALYYSQRKGTYDTDSNIT